MARTVRDAKLESRQARIRLTARSEPHWRAITEGCHLGYYKGARSGAWIGRFRKPDGAYVKKRLGAADDIADADGSQFLSYKQAHDAAMAWFEEQRAPQRPEAPAPYTVSKAADDYLLVYEAGQTRGGGKGIEDTRSSINAFIRPSLGSRPLAELTTEELAAWHRGLAALPPRKRRRKTAGEIAYLEVDMTDPDIIRQRRASANRILTVLKAILNHAPREKGGGKGGPWADVSPYKEVDAPTVRWLEPAEAKQLIKASAEDFQHLATGALLTGARYSELGRMKVQDFSAQGQGVHIRKAKGQTPRFIHLTDEGVTFFTARCADKEGKALLFQRSNGAAWKKNDQRRPLADACEVAKIIPAIGFHILRHTYGSWLAMRGVAMKVIAEQLGHKDTRMTEKHYAHLAPSYVADTVRAAFSGIGALSPATETGDSEDDQE
jgi:integrase